MQRLHHALAWLSTLGGNPPIATDRVLDRASYRSIEFRRSARRTRPLQTWDESPTPEGEALALAS